ncbi:glycoside hydrolase family 99-like domain-containing protein [Paenibacillus vini]|uniref:glycoside hydrolase family 99-like domain-containing protein n=1 Tax=Paenibacillus vini TaxID=1476024 RepID=UPI0025B66B13|nr:glycoside hydrolase family 99-like domain-containing protein [Paenibacillus vini]MDN4066449.1 glycoside hydrolase family 99-like domain-containing protein [Paenibacillus vini]
MKIIAFYLPQYHPIQENNEWWGNGFTEWTNVSKARPQFNGHYQPHIPADMGFYDLRLSETRESQAKLAKKYGIDAFCYYHYWFNGKMLLERPFNEVVESGKPDHEFCLCWANENWTKRWDGMDQHILIKQNYEEYDPSEHIRWLSQAFKDSRYIKINNRPLFLIYRASDIPNLKEVITSWRTEIKEQGFDDIYVVCANNSQNILSIQDITEAGFDAVYEFAPNLKDFDERLSVSSIPGLNIYSYKKIVERDMKKKVDSEIPIFPCVFPSWDNTPRRSNNATVIQNEDASLYSTWLINSIEKVKEFSVEEQLVFINAWNEWGEGCHLEPDLKHGHMFLEATKNALTGKQYNNGLNAVLKNNDLAKIKGSIKFDSRRPLYIWGTGVAGQRILEFFKSAKIHVVGFIDGNESKVNTIVNGLKVYSRSILRSDNDYAPFVCIASMFHEDIEPLLIESNYVRNIDYVVNISNATIKKEYKKDQTQIVIEHGCYCNICGFGKFVTRNAVEICEKCGSKPHERMLIEILSEELGVGGLPLSEWLNLRDMNLLNVGAVSEEIPFLNLVFQSAYVETLERNAPIISCTEFDYALFSLKNETEVHSLIDNINSGSFFSSKIIILAHNEMLYDKLLSLMNCLNNKISKIERMYWMYKTGFQHVLIVDNQI